MKKCLTVLLAAAMLSTSLFCVNAADLETPIDEEIIEEYAYTLNVYSEISASSNTATCRSTVIGKSGVTKIVVSQKLQKKVDGTWTNIKKWTKTVTSVSTTFTNTKSSLSSGTYRTRTVAKVYKGNDYETVSANSTTVKIS